MDAEKRRAIGACGTCGLPEDAHKYATGEDPESMGVLAALGGPCGHFTASAAAMGYQRHLAMASRAPVRTGRRGPICLRCGNRGHRREDCPF